MRFNPEIRYGVDELEKLISKGESVQLDFKQSISSSRKIARTLAAFANNRGGKLLIGVRDNGHLLGCDVEEEMHMVYEAAEHFCEPPVDVSFIIYETEEGIAVLEAAVKNSLKKPHFAMNDHDEWQLYMRSQDKTMLASANTRKILQNEGHEEIDSSQLDSKERFILEFLQKNESISPKEFARRMNISLQRANNILVKLTQLGLILHNKDGRGDYYTLR